MNAFLSTERETVTSNKRRTTHGLLINAVASRWQNIINHDLSRRGNFQKLLWRRGNF